MRALRQLVIKSETPRNELFARLLKSGVYFCVSTLTQTKTHFRKSINAPAFKRLKTNSQNFKACLIELFVRR